MRVVLPGCGGRMHRASFVLPKQLLQLGTPNRNEIARNMPLTVDRPLQLPDGLRFVFLCFTNRSGSNYLCRLLLSAGMTDDRGELFIVANVLRAQQEHGVKSFPEYFEYLAGQTWKNNMFFSKIAAEHLRLFVESDILRQIAGRCHFIVISRSDKLGQAISLSIASQNQRWASYLQPRIPDEQLEFSVQDIEAKIDWITRQHMCLDQFFAYNGMVPTAVWYEWMLQYPQQTVDESASALGRPSAPVDVSRVDLSKQANHINTLWRERFLSRLLEADGENVRETESKPATDVAG